MALERHNSAQEFDTMFRRHLKQGGAPVTPCVGFDADTASAYLERALSVSAQTQFEAHLAGCAACRRYVVGMARLDSEIESATAKRPLIAAEPVWSRWYGTVAQWLDFSGWNRGWATAATACGVLLTALAMTTWQRMSAPQNAPTTVANSPAPEAAVSAPPDGQPTGAFTAQAKAGTEPKQTELSSTPQPQAGLIALAEDRGRMVVPTPIMPPAVTLHSNLAAVAPRPEIRSALPEISNPNFGSQPPSPPPPGLTAAPVTFGANRQGLAMPVGFGGAPIRRASSQITWQPNALEQRDLVAELVPEPARARDAGAKPAANEKGTSDPAAAARERELAKALKGGRAFGLMPLRDVDARTKEADAKEAKEQVKPLMKHLNGHTFYFDHGFWIDEEYKSDATMPLIRLQRGNERYQQILIENPSLEQFFQLGQVIVVWKGKIYEVRK